ncbi:MAG TPA: glycosyltransferase, partial [Planctomycetota bacterium]|nr:glycosyltransferase [Planctomycetota bacterium]
MWPELRKFASELPIVGPALRSAYRKAHGLPDVAGAQSEAPDFKYHSWIERRVRERAEDYPVPSENAPRFDILTLVFDTEAEVLRKTAASVFAQDYPESLWRWVIWDNGSTREETRTVLAELAKDKRVKMLCSEKNFGIATGHFKALELCEAEYVALLDHDDLLYPDALRIAAFNIDFHMRPHFLYSDEDKCDMQDRRFWPYFKPDFSPALLLDTGYTCHLSVAKLETLRACGAFSDAATDGAQDWDMALRIADHPGSHIIHIPEILYTWRGVQESTAVRGVDAKPQVIAAQKRCVESALERRGLRDACIVAPNELFPDADGHWRIRFKSPA